MEKFPVAPALILVAALSATCYPLIDRGPGFAPLFSFAMLRALIAGLTQLEILHNARQGSLRRRPDSRRFDNVPDDCRLKGLRLSRHQSAASDFGHPARTGRIHAMAR
jgi:hypothetical protein